MLVFLFRLDIRAFLLSLLFDLLLLLVGLLLLKPLVCDEGAHFDRLSSLLDETVDNLEDYFELLWINVLVEMHQVVCVHLVVVVLQQLHDLVLLYRLGFAMLVALLLHYGVVAVFKGVFRTSVAHNLGDLGPFLALLKDELKQSQFFFFGPGAPQFE